MSEQRAFLAREIHDVVTHSLTVMVAQADGGRYGEPEEKDEALRTVGEVGRKSLSQMREVVALLRTPESRPADVLVITVANPFTGAPVEHAGQGLRGMRERASLIGGSVQAGPSDPQRWTATLEVPYPAPDMRRHT